MKRILMMMAMLLLAGAVVSGCTSWRSRLPEQFQKRAFDTDAPKGQIYTDAAKSTAHERCSTKC